MTATWVFFTAVVFAQFCFIALVPVLAPVYAVQVIGAACLLTEAYAYARGLPRRAVRHEAVTAHAGLPSSAAISG